MFFKEFPKSTLKDEYQTREKDSKRIYLLLGIDITLLLMIFLFLAVNGNDGEAHEREIFALVPIYRFSLIIITLFGAAGVCI